MDSEHPQTATDEPTPAGPPDPSAAVDRLVSASDWPDPALIEEVIAAGEPAVGPLLDRMRSALETPDKAGDNILYYGTGVLSELRAPAAIPVLAAIVRRDPEDIGEFAAEVLGDLGSIAFEPALELIRDAGVAGYSRANAIEAAKRAAGSDPALRARLGDALRPLLADAIERVRSEAPAPEGDEPEGPLAEDRDDEETDENEEALRQERYESQAIEDAAPLKLEAREELMFRVIDLADLADPQAREMIDRAFQEDLVDTFWVDKESVDESYRKGGERPRPRVDWLDGYRRRRQEHFEYEKRRKVAVRPSFQSALGPMQAREEEEPPPPPETIRNVGPKLGRNDPCWCGSGKKYKKCHLGKDEKA